MQTLSALQVAGIEPDVRCGTSCPHAPTPLWWAVQAARFVIGEKIEALDAKLRELETECRCAKKDLPRN